MTPTEIAEVKKIIARGLAQGTIRQRFDVGQRPRSKKGGQLSMTVEALRSRRKREATA